MTRSSAVALDYRYDGLKWCASVTLTHGRFVRAQAALASASVGRLDNAALCAWSALPVDRRVMSTFAALESWAIWRPTVKFQEISPPR